MITKIKTTLLFLTTLLLLNLNSFSVNSANLDAWKLKASKEKELVVHGRWKENTLWKELYSEFKKDYPNIIIKYERKGLKQNIKSIVTFKQTKKFTTDVFIGFTDYLDILYKENHLEDLSDIPEYTQIRNEHRGVNNKWASYSVKAWCAVYNTDKFKKNELPKDLNLFLEYVKRNNKLILVNNKGKVYSSFLNKYSKNTVENIMDNVFSTKPYKTTSGISKSFSLLSLGEFDFILFMGVDNIERYKKTGMPIEKHCFSEIPLTSTPIAIIKNSEAKYSAKLFVNWILSSKGQQLIYKIDGRLPVRKNELLNNYLNSNSEFLFRSWKTYIEDVTFLDKEWSKRFYQIKK